MLITILIFALMWCCATITLYHVLLSNARINDSIKRYEETKDIKPYLWYKGPDDELALNYFGKTKGDHNE